MLLEQVSALGRCDGFSEALDDYRLLGVHAEPNRQSARVKRIAGHFVVYSIGEPSTMAEESGANAT